MRRRRIWAAVLLAGLLTGCAAPEGVQGGQEPEASGSSTVQMPELPALDSVQELEDLTPAEFGCLAEDYPTRYDTYALLPGDELENTVHVLTGAEEGPVIYIVGGTHGDELAGWYAGALLKKASVRAGTVYIAAPFNQYGAEHDQRKTRGGWDLNRHFPGDPDGNEAERMSAALYEDIWDKAPDLVLDLHEARYHTDGQDNLGGSIICQDMELISDLVLSLLADSKAGGLPVTRPLSLYGSPPEGSLNRTVTQELGIPVITVETDRREALNARVRDHLLVAEYIFMWYNLL